MPSLTNITDHHYPLAQISYASPANYSAEMAGLGVGGGDTGHPTDLDCPSGVVGCSCGGRAESACRSGIQQPTPANPSNGVPVTSVGRAGGRCGWTRGVVGCVTSG